MAYERRFWRVYEFSIKAEMEERKRWRMLSSLVVGSSDAGNANRESGTDGSHRSNMNLDGFVLVFLGSHLIVLGTPAREMCWASSCPAQVAQHEIWHVCRNPMEPARSINMSRLVEPRESLEQTRVFLITVRYFLGGIFTYGWSFHQQTSILAVDGNPPFANFAYLCDDLSKLMRIRKKIFSRISRDSICPCWSGLQMFRVDSCCWSTLRVCISEKKIWFDPPNDMSTIWCELILVLGWFYVYYLYVVYMYEVAHIEIDAPHLQIYWLQVEKPCSLLRKSCFLNIYSPIPYRMANLWEWYQQSFHKMRAIGQPDAASAHGCSEMASKQSNIKQNSQGEMNFKGYHDVVASSLAAPSVGGAVHPGFAWTCIWHSFSCWTFIAVVASQECHEKPDVDERWHYSTFYASLLGKHRFCHISSLQISTCFGSFPSIRSLWRWPFHSDPAHEAMP